MINFPEKVLIDSVLYSIKRTDNPIINNRQECSGEIDYDKAEILISSREDTLGDGNSASILMHEIVHAILYERGMHEETTNETLVDELAKGFVNFVRMNPKMIQCIVNTGKMQGTFEDEKSIKDFSLNSLVHIEN